MGHGAMKAAFRTWGNSLALRIPKDLAEEIGAKDGRPATIEVRDGKLVIEVIKPKKKRLTIEELCKGLGPQEETDWGPLRGNEYW